jgi:alpha-D-ribose 1-methylphosphonate 5-triphosphate synthase subunit PhnH
MVRETCFHEVVDSQKTFRALLDAISRPGAVRRVPVCGYRAMPRGFCPPALTVLKTLCDHRVSFSIGLGAREADVIRYLEVNLGAPFQPVAEADYVLFEGETGPQSDHVRRA